MGRETEREEEEEGTQSPYLLGGLLDELLDEHGWPIDNPRRSRGAMSKRSRATPDEGIKAGQD
jgi:hypothetical protein